jgi:hypothetical protein
MKLIWIVAAAAAGAGVCYYVLKRDCGCHQTAAATPAPASSPEPQKAITVAQAPGSPDLFRTFPQQTSSEAVPCTDCKSTTLTARAAMTRAL